MSYYTSVIIMVLLALLVLSVLISENNRIPLRKKRLFFITNLLIACAAIAECGGIHINGNTNIPSWLLLAVKALDYTLTPMAGGALIALIRKKDSKLRFIQWLFAANAVFQVLAAFFGWMVIVDDGNHYSHGPLYPVYMVLYIVVLLVLAVELILYGKQFKKQNRVSLYATVLLMFIGIGLQEILGSDHRVAYLALTFGAAYLFIHYSEFAQLEMDDTISEQQVKISSDALTGVYSRFAYVDTMNAYTANMPKNLTVFMFDINGLKVVNDSLGHEAGDELIRGAADCIASTIGKGTKTYRIGGDEFVVFADMTNEQAEAALKELEAATQAWSGEKVKNLSISAGYAQSKDFVGRFVEDLTKEADKAMYEQKKEYYLRVGKVR